MIFKKIISIVLCTALLGSSLTGCAKEENQGPTINGKVTIYLSRHGETEYNVKGLAQGWSDSPLTKLGIEQAKALNTGLKGVDFSNVYTSTSQRAIDTANLVMEGRDIAITEDERLKEMNYGSLEANPAQRLWAKGEDYTWENGWVDYGGENFYLLAERGFSALYDIVADEVNLNKNVFVSTHGMTILSILYEVDYEAADSLLEGLENCSVTIIEYENGEFKLTSLNDTSYLEME